MTKIETHIKEPTFWAKNWYLLYFVLGGFAIMTICISLYSAHTNIKKYEQALEYVEEKIKIQTQITKISEALLEANAPGNDIFEVRDLQFQKKKFEEAHKNFEFEMNKLKNLISKFKNAEQEFSNEFGLIIDIEKSYNEMRQETYNIFAAFQKAQEVKAAISMSKMDQQYAASVDLIEKLRAYQNNSISQVLIKHDKILQQKKDAENIYGILTAIIILGTSVFGRYLSRFINEAFIFARRNQEIINAVSKSAIVAFTDKNGKITDVNENFCKISGYTKEELIGEDHRLVNSGYHDSHFFKNLWKTISSGEVWTGDIKNKSKNGEIYYVRSVITPLRNTKGEIEQYMAVRFDVTAQKETENELTNAQKIAKLGSWTFDLITHKQTWSQEHYNIFEIESPQPQDVLYKLYRERIHPDDLKILDILVERAITLGEDFIFDHRVVLDSGKRIKYVQGIGKVHKDSTGKPILVSGTCQDLTDRKINEIESQTILSTMSEGLVIQDKDGKIEKFNPEALKILSLTEDQLLGRTSLDPNWKSIHEDGSPFKGEEHPAMVALRTKAPVRDCIMGLKLASGDERWIQINAVPFNNSQEIKVAVTFADITSIFKKQRQITALQDQNRLILRSTGMGIWKYNVKTQDLEWDKSLYDLYELNPSDFTADYQAWESTLSPTTKEIVVEELNKALSGEKDFDTTFEIKTQSGKNKYLGGRGTVIRDTCGNATLMYGVNWDRTKEIQLEQEIAKERSKLVQNSKLASLGEMAAGIAHEINNPLAVINGNLQLLDRFRNDETKFKSKIEAMFKSSERIEKIVKGLKKFSRSTELKEFKVEKVESIISEALVITEAKAKRNATDILIDIAPEIKIYCDQVEIEQVVINLISNGIDAVKNLDEKWVKIKGFECQDSIIVQVIDSGNGISSEIENKLFDPFFTTKKLGEGTGLGLSITKGILDHHKATITLNRSFENTCFEIKFQKIEEQKMTA